VFTLDFTSGSQQILGVNSMNKRRQIRLLKDHQVGVRIAAGRALKRTSSAAAEKAGVQ